MRHVLCLLIAAMSPLLISQAARGISATVVVEPDACPPGTIFQLAGSGYPALATGGVTFDRVDLGAISSDQTGAIRGFFMVPNVRSGPAKVRVVIGKTRGDASFSVLDPGTPSACTTTTP